MADGSDSHLFDDAPQGVGAAISANAAQAAPAAPLGANLAATAPLGSGAGLSDDHLFDDAPQGMRESSAAGSFVRGAAEGAAPALGGLEAAEGGAALGVAATAAGGPVGGALAGGAAGAGIGYGFGEGLGYPKTGAAIGGALGGLAGAFGGAPIVGGLAGAFGGSAAVNRGQDWLINQLPQSWQDKYREQQTADVAQHPIAEFTGGLAPFALTMSPAMSKLPENATTFQKLMATPLTARLLSGTIFGGTELGQEYAGGEAPDWAKIGISTGMGFFLPGRSKFGETILSPIHAAEARLAGQKPATVAEAADAKVMGPGVTEDVYQGQEQQNPELEAAAQQAARDEKMASEGPPKPDVSAAARQSHPELFSRYDDLQEHLASARQAVQTLRYPPDEEYEGLQKRYDDLSAQHDATNNRAAQRQIRAQIRDVSNQWADLDERRAAFESHATAETPELASARQRVMEADFAIRDLLPDLQAAYRRTAESLGTETVAPEAEMAAPEAPPTAPEAAATAGEAKPPDTPPQPSVATPEMRQTIADDVSRQLKTAGRPADEAEAAGDLVAARFANRATAMRGAIGTAEELYAREGARIVDGRGVARPVKAAARTEPVAAPETAPQAALDPEKVRLAQQKAQDNGVAKLIGILSGQGVNPQEISKFIGEKMSADEIKDAVSAAPRDVEMAQETPGERELEQTKQGKINLTPGEPRATITMLRDADPSTIIHEQGHDFLEQMKRDGAHEAAPQWLKDDLDTVRGWVKNRGGEFTTAQHEKFARGFERYMSLGVAPNKQLASVFSRFKSWLRDVFDAILKRGGKTPDDLPEQMKGVYARLFDENPQHIVVAEHPEAGPTLPDIHEADAAVTHPKDAEAVGDKVVAERDQAVAEHHPNVQAEIQNAVRAREAAKPAGEGDEGASGPSGVVGGGRGPESEPGGGPRGEAGGAQQRGGEPTVSEGARLGGNESGGSGETTERGPNAGDGARNGIAPTNVERLEPRSPSELVDKAGNIRLENLTDDADARRAIREAAAANDDFVGDRRGIVTDQQVEDLAAALGKELSFVDQRRIGQAFNAEQIVAARKLLISSATKVSDLAKKAATGSDQDVMAYSEGVERHRMIQGVVSGVTAEAGRALRAFRDISGSKEAKSIDDFLKGATGRTLFQKKLEAKLVAQLGTTPQISATVDRMGKPTWGKGILEYWINGLITGLPTHITYSIGNTLLTIERAVIETPTAAAIGALRAGMGREGNIIPFGEAAARFKAGVHAIPTALEAAGQSARTGLTTLLPGETPRGNFASQYGGALHEGATYGDAMKTWYGVGRGLWDGVLAAGQLVAAGGDPSAPFFSTTPSRGYFPNLAIKGVGVPMGEIFGRSGGRLVATIHSFFKAMNYSIEMNGLEFRRAWDEGHRGDALAQRVAEQRLNRDPEDMAASVGEATEAALMGEGGKWTKKLSAVLNHDFNVPVIGPTPLLKFIDPFTRISSNIINQSIVQRTPLGILAPSIRADLMGKNGSIAADRAAARMLVGSALGMTFGMLAGQGYVTGAGPSDRNKAAMWRQAGYQAHSVKIGDTWYDLHRLGPLGMLLGMAADLYDLARDAPTEDFATAAGSFQHALTQSVLDESFMRGPSELLKALEDKSYAPIYIRNFVSSFVPFSVESSYLARSMDPYQRQTRSIMDAIKAKIPGESETVLPRVDIWGNPMPQRNALGGSAMTAIWASQQSQDPVNMEMARLGIGKAPVQRKIRNQTLSDQEYNDYAQLAGKMTKTGLDRIVNSPNWRSVPDSAKEHVVDEIFRQSRDGAANIMMAKHPDIPNNAALQKRAKAQGAGIRSLQ